MLCELSVFLTVQWVPVSPQQRSETTYYVAVCSSLTLNGSQRDLWPKMCGPHHTLTIQAAAAVLAYLGDK